MTDRRLSDLHPAGFAAVPVALLLDPAAESADILVYAAIASDVNFKTGRSDPRRGTRRLRILERSGIRDLRTFRASRDRLRRLGYLSVTFRRGRAPIYELLPTTDAVIGRLQTDQAADLDAAPDASGARGGSRVGASTSPTPGASTSPTPQSSAEDVREDAGGTSRVGASTSPTLTESGVASLRQAVGRKAADDAIAEVEFRIAHPEVAGEVTTPDGLAREIGECYRGRCRKPDHSDLHGTAARDYHRGRRADFEQAERETTARARQQIAADLDDDLDSRRDRYRDGLARFEEAAS